MTIVNKGHKIKDITLRNHHGEKVNLGELKGKVLLAFHPLAFTGVCTDQMRDLESRYEDFEKLGVTPIGVSVDAHPSKAVWAQSLGLKNLELLSDFNPIGDLAKDLGIFMDKAGISSRAVFLIENGEVLWSKEYDKPQRPDVDEILDSIKNL